MIDSQHFKNNNSILTFVANYYIFVNMPDIKVTLQKTKNR